MGKLQGRITSIVMAGVIALSSLGWGITSASATGGPSCPIGSSQPYALYGTSGDLTAIGSTTVTFYASRSLACGAPISSYSWDFGDGTTGEGVSISHVYGVGVFRPVLTVTDEAGLVSVSPFIQTVTVKEANFAPLTTAKEVTTDNGYSYILDLTDNISDPDGDQVSFQATSVTPSGLTAEVISYVAGTKTLKIYSVYGAVIRNTDVVVNYTVSDQFGGLTPGVATVHFVNTAPVANDATFQVAEDAYATFDMTSYVSDKNNDSLTFTPGTPSHGNVYVQSGKRLLYVPSRDYNGTDSFTYTVSDGVASTTATVYVTVTPVNDAPAGKFVSRDTQEDTPLTIDPLTAVTDVDNDTLSVVSMSVGNGTVTQNSDGTITFVPQANFTGTTQITLTFTDGQTTAQGYINVKVTPVNDAPQISNVTWTKGTKSFAKTASVSVVASDIDNDQLKYTYDFGDGSVATTTWSNQSSHTYSRKGTYAVTVTVTDPSGATATYAITVEV